MRVSSAGRMTVVLAVCVTALAGCGGGSGSGSSSGYCDDVGSAKDAFIGLSVNEITQDEFDDLVGTVHTIRAEAPPGVEEAWATYSRAIDTFHADLAKTSLTMDDLANMQNGHMSTGHDMEAAMKAASSFSTIAVGNAQAAIRTEVEKSCGLDLEPTG
jgi:hypothetical protein